MAMEVNTPNVVMDDNYKMFVKALARRYAERGASVYMSAEAIEQERKSVRTRAMAPDAYRLSKEGQATADLYKNGIDGDDKYMTTEDYLRYFDKCHDTFEAVTYYNRHVETEEVQSEAKVIVNKKRIEEIRRMQDKKVRRRVHVQEVSFSDKVAEFFSSMGTLRRRALAGMSAVAVSMMLFAGGLFLFSPEAPEASYARENPADEEVAMAIEQETPAIVQE